MTTLTLTAVRLGLATNSSSSHSMILGRGLRDHGTPGAYDEMDVFVAASRAAKLMYLVAVLRESAVQNGPEVLGDDPDTMIRALCELDIDAPLPDTEYGNLAGPPDLTAPDGTLDLDRWTAFRDTVLDSGVALTGSGWPCAQPLTITDPAHFTAAHRPHAPPRPDDGPVDDAARFLRLNAAQRRELEVVMDLDPEEQHALLGVLTGLSAMPASTPDTLDWEAQERDALATATPGRHVAALDLMTERLHSEEREQTRPLYEQLYALRRHVPDPQLAHLRGLLALTPPRLLDVTQGRALLMRANGDDHALEFHTSAGALDWIYVVDPDANPARHWKRT